MTIKTHFSLIIIGSGPAGYTAGIYARRAMIDTLMIEGMQPGGQLTITTEVENFPGFISIQGPELMVKMREHAEKFGLAIDADHVEEVDLKTHPFKVKTMLGKEFTANALIIATGASAKWLGIPGEKEFMGKGVSGCATCDGFFFKDKVVMVVGGGDTAMEDATYLTNHAKKVYVVHRRDKLRASKAMQERALNNPKIEFIWNTVPVEVLGNNAVEGVKLKNVKTGEIFEKKIDGFFVAIGHKPNTEFLKGQLELDESGYIITKPDSTYTSVEGVFAAGDVRDKVYRQAITAAGSGCMAAIDAERWLEEKNLK
ncbi:thioredoxin reductase (NADPH) [Thermotomaculum hydrothermale]|uniref:Thioredoxin reductase n=1 Tax=Thermotomaculum hydrothermale TaxID=981385 RepID=A0A7R6SZ16_9BACT|nr:thioredoxin-disulfide reductase [Thermotomaculum hydrothermale]BBB32355.1 thioredoxin reductase (NADPH) [Thermotomaculum hydrothermale]